MLACILILYFRGCWTFVRKEKKIINEKIESEKDGRATWEKKTKQIKIYKLEKL